MENNIWIRIKFFTDSQLKGREELVSDLSKVCVVQDLTEWIPAESSGTEFIAEILLNASLSDLFENVVLPGFTWDAIKLSLSKIWKALLAFADKNDEIRLPKLTIRSNDITIKLNEVMGDQLSFIHDFYDCLKSHWPTLKAAGIKNVNRIELPVRPNDDNTDVLQYVNPDLDETPDNCVWLISYDFGVNHCYYIPTTKSVIAP